MIDKLLPYEHAGSFIFLTDPPVTHLLVTFSLQIHQFEASKTGLHLLHTVCGKDQWAELFSHGTVTHHVDLVTGSRWKMG